MTTERERGREGKRERGEGREGERERGSRGRGGVEGEGERERGEMERGKKYNTEQRKAWHSGERDVTLTACHTCHRTCIPF